MGERQAKNDWTMYVWLVYLSFFIAYPTFKSHVSPWEWIATIGGTIIFLALYFRGYSLQGRAIIPVIVLITLLGVIFFPFNAGAGAFFIYAGAFASRLGRGRSPIWTIIAIEVVQCVEILAIHTPLYNAVWPPLFTALVGAVNIHYESVHRSNYRLRMANDEIERLAKVAERERIARDLHDLLGHTLSLIILKSELASKVADPDPQRARDEIRDVERIARDALAQVREAIGGYRRGGLLEELDSAKQMLLAASIDCSASVETIPLLPSHEAIVSLALREAITNVVRHSGAKRCTIDIRRSGNELRVRISDDGRGSSTPEGLGLTGMRERLAAIGGALKRESHDGTTLTIQVPLDRMEQSA